MLQVQHQSAIFNVKTILPSPCWIRPGVDRVERESLGRGFVDSHTVV